MADDDDPWHYPRSALAQQYFDQFESRLTQAAVIFGPRRTGKTEFLLKDLGPLVQAMGWRTAYASLWQSRLSPLAVLLHALTNAQRKGSLSGRADALRKATKLRLGGGVLAKAEAEIDLTQLSGAAQNDLLLVLDDVIENFAPKGKRALLLIDEAQELATNADNQSLVAALRTSLDKRKDRLAVLFTGSSQDGLRRMFSRKDAPFFHFGALADWPPLEDNFVPHMLAVFAKVIGVNLDQRACSKAFLTLERNPFYFRKLLEILAFDPKRDVGGALASVRDRAAEDFRYHDQWRNLSSIQRAVAQALARDPANPFSKASLANLDAKLHTAPTRAQVQAALRHLMRAEIISKTQDRGGYAFDDPEFANWISANTS